MRLLKTKAQRTWLGVAIVAAFLGFVSWRIFVPKIGHATVAEIDAALPADLVQPPKADPAAQDRQNQVAQIAAKLDDVSFFSMQHRDMGIYMSQAGSHDPQRQTLQRETTLPVERARLAKIFWSQNQEDLRKLKKILNAGPLQFQLDRTWSDDAGFLLHEESFARTLSATAYGLALSGDYQSAGEVLDLGLALGAKSLAADGDSLLYSESLSILMGMDDAVRSVARLSDCPTDLCRHLLDEMPPTPRLDVPVVVAMKRDFQEFTVAKLADPEAMAKKIGERQSALPDSFDSCGQFDPIRTAKLLGATLKKDIENASKPFNAYDGVSAAIDKTWIKDLPRPPKPPIDRGWRGTWDKAIFTFLMNLTDNSLGRWSLEYLNSTSRDVLLYESTGWRARREASRALVATILYRRDHQGKLPDTLTDLVPKQLIGVPVDPFTEGPMHYSAEKQRVWSANDLTKIRFMVTFGHRVFNGYAADVSITHR